MCRSPCCSEEEGLNRGAWTAPEDRILQEYVKVHGEGHWPSVPKKAEASLKNWKAHYVHIASYAHASYSAGLKRCGKSCRLRWLNYLRPDIKGGDITPDEEDLIIRLHKLLGNRWTLIAGRLPGRTNNEIKNYWNSNLSKREKKRGNSWNQSKREYNKKKKIATDTFDGKYPKEDEEATKHQPLTEPEPVLSNNDMVVITVQPTNEDVYPPSKGQGLWTAEFTTDCIVGCLSHDMDDLSMILENDSDLHKIFSDEDVNNYMASLLDLFHDGDIASNGGFVMEDRGATDCFQDDMYDFDFEALSSFLESADQDWML